MWYNSLRGCSSGYSRKSSFTQGKSMLQSKYKSYFRFTIWSKIYWWHLPKTYSHQTFITYISVSMKSSFWLLVTGCRLLARNRDLRPFTMPSCRDLKPSWKPYSRLVPMPRPSPRIRIHGSPGMYADIFFVSLVVVFVCTPCSLVKCF